MNNRKIKLAPSVKIRAEKFGAILFDKSREQYFVVNEVGKDILECLKEVDTLDGLFARLNDTYKASPEKMKEDIQKFIDGLKAAKLLAD